jgi:hypothetical protein
MKGELDLETSFPCGRDAARRRRVTEGARTPGVEGNQSKTPIRGERPLQRIKQ